MVGSTKHKCFIFIHSKFIIAEKFLAGEIDNTDGVSLQSETNSMTQLWEIVTSI